MQKRFKDGLYAGLAFAVGLGLFLAWKWQPERQIAAHTEALFSQLEARDWDDFSALLDDQYKDQWGHDRATLTDRLQQISPYLRGAKLVAHDPIVTAEKTQGVWEGKVTVEGEGEGVTLVQERINGLATPFRLEWRRVSRKPWDWKLAGVTNSGLELPGQFY